LLDRSILSIVIVTKNNLEDLFLTLNSLGALHKVEIVVVNGSEIPFTTKVVSELIHRGCRIVAGPDSGIYDGMNKGLAASRGEFIWFLNSGDQCSPTLPMEAFVYFLGRTSAEWIIGLQDPPLAMPKIALRLSKTLLVNGLRPIPHQSTVMRRETLKEAGGFNLNYPIVADQEMFLKLIVKGVKPFLFSNSLSFRMIGGVGDRQPVGSFKRQVKEIAQRNGVQYSSLEFCFGTILKGAYLGLGLLHKLWVKSKP
jgi:hypothetical protein